MHNKIKVQKYEKKCIFAASFNSNVMKKLLAFLLALTGFAFVSCNNDIETEYGIRVATYDEKTAVDDNCPAITPEQAMEEVDFPEETAGK